MSEIKGDFMKENNIETDQYQIRCEEWRLKALESDFKERYEALELAGYDEKMLPIKYFGVDYLIDRMDARLYEAAEPDKEIDSTTQFAIYHLFYYSKKSLRIPAILCLCTN